MRVLPLALIAIGVFGVLKHLGFIDPAFVHLFWPVLLIGIGVAMLYRIIAATSERGTVCVLARPTEAVIALLRVTGLIEFVETIG